MLLPPGNADVRRERELARRGEIPFVPPSRFCNAVAESAGRLCTAKHDPASALLGPCRECKLQTCVRCCSMYRLFQRAGETINDFTPNVAHGALVCCAPSCIASFVLGRRPSPCITSEVQWSAGADADLEKIPVVVSALGAVQLTTPAVYGFIDKWGSLLEEEFVRPTLAGITPSTFHQGSNFQRVEAIFDTARDSFRHASGEAASKMSVMPRT